MKFRIGGGILAVLILTGSSLGALAISKGNPYGSIVARNPFGLRPIPPLSRPVEVEATPAPALAEIKLLGITTLPGISKALLRYEDKQTKKVEFPFPMSEGETYKTCTVLGIDVEQERVLIRNGETQTMLDFPNHGVKPALFDAPHKPQTVPPSNSLTSGAVNYTNSRIIVLGGGANIPSPSAKPAVSPAMTRDEAEAVIEITRRKLQMQEQTGQSQAGPAHSQILPPTRMGDALKQPFTSPSR